MKAMRLEACGKPLVLRQVEIPSPSAGQVLVKTESFPLEAANEVLAKLREGRLTGAAVLVSRTTTACMGASHVDCVRMVPVHLTPSLPNHTNAPPANSRPAFVRGR